MTEARHPVDLPRGLPHAVPGAELHEPGSRLRRGLPPGRRAVGLRQVDEMPREPGSGLAEQTRSEPPVSGRHAPRRTSRNAQVSRSRFGTPFMSNLGCGMHL